MLKATVGRIVKSPDWKGIPAASDDSSLGTLRSYAPGESLRGALQYTDSGARCVAAADHTRSDCQCLTGSDHTGLEGARSIHNIGGWLASFVPVTPGGVQSYVGVLAGISLLGIAIQCDLSTFNDEGESASPSGPGRDSEQSDSREGSSDRPGSRGIIYARVSSRGQVVDGMSLDERIRNLTAVADEWGIDIVQKLQDAARRVGTSTERGFDRCDG